MINADETRPPQLGGFQNINAAETVAPGGGAVADAGASLHLMSGESVAGSYIINAMLSGQGKQSDVYLAKNGVSLMWLRFITMVGILRRKCRIF